LQELDGRGRGAAGGSLGDDGSLLAGSWTTFRRGSSRRAARAACGLHRWGCRQLQNEETGFVGFSG